MIYFVVSLLLLIYFELLGRWICYKFFKKKMNIYFPIGFLFLNAIVYVTMLLTINDVSFYLLLFIYLIIVIISLFFIVADFKKIDHSINKICLIIVLIIMGILTYYSFNTSLGNLHGFDTLYYINFTTNNIGNSTLNSHGVYLNGPFEELQTYYTGQTYYYFVGISLFIIRKICTILKINFFYETGFIWIFQLLFNFLYGALISESILKTKKKLLAILPSFLLVFLFGKLYFNNVYGFFGNSLLTISSSYAIMFLYDYLDSKKDSDKYLFYLCLYACCSFSSSGIFILLFALVGFYFFSYNEQNILKEYALLLLLPLINGIHMEIYNPFIYYCVPLIISLSLYFLDKPLSKIVNDRTIKYLLAFCFIATFILSRLYSEHIFDFHGLLETTSQKGDMNLDYFHISNHFNLENIYKILILLLFCFSLFIKYNTKYVKFIIILIIIFFNPFCCNFIYNYVKVYYRAYVLIINPFSIIILFDLLICNIKNKYAYSIVCIIILLSIYKTDFINPIYYHYEHIPTKDYNPVYKMCNDQIDVIKQLKDNIGYYEEERPYIITGNLLTQGMINNGRYLFGRGYYKPDFWSNDEKKLYEIFYTPEYLGDSMSDNPDYNNMNQYILNAHINYIVVDKNVEYYDNDLSKYSYLFLKVNEVCNIYPIYENETYVIYHFVY